MDGESFAYIGTKLMSDGQKNSGNVSCGLIQQSSPACFGGKWTLYSLSCKQKKPSRLLSVKGAKAGSHDGMGVHQCPQCG